MTNNTKNRKHQRKSIYCHWGEELELGLEEKHLQENNWQRPSMSTTTTTTKRRPEEVESVCHPQQEKEIVAGEKAAGVSHVTPYEALLKSWTKHTEQ